MKFAYSTSERDMVSFVRRTMDNYSLNSFKHQSRSNIKNIETTSVRIWYLPHQSHTIRHCSLSFPFNLQQIFFYIFPRKAHCENKIVLLFCIKVTRNSGRCCVTMWSSRWNSSKCLFLIGNNFHKNLAPLLPSLQTSRFHNYVTP